MINEMDTNLLPGEYYKHQVNFIYIVVQHNLHSHVLRYVPKYLIFEKQRYTFIFYCLFNI